MGNNFNGNDIDSMDDRHEYYKKLIAIGIPILFQNLVGMCLNLLDTLMIGRLGEEELAAVGAANQVYFIFTVVLFGLFSGIKAIFGLSCNPRTARQVSFGKDLFAVQVIKYYTDRTGVKPRSYYIYFCNRTDTAHPYKFGVKR